MKKLFRTALLGLVVLAAVAPAPALPPQCSAEYCADSPDIVCSTFGTRVVTCGSWCSTNPC